MNLLDLLLEPLQYEFMVRALVATVIAAVLCAVLSCWLVLIGWSLMGDAVSHAVLPGVVIAYILGAPFAICRHPDPREPSARRTMTTGAVLIDLDERAMHVANGPPCSNEYVAFAL